MSEHWEGPADPYRKPGYRIELDELPYNPIWRPWMTRLCIAVIALAGPVTYVIFGWLMIRRGWNTGVLFAIAPAAAGAGFVSAGANFISPMDGQRNDTTRILMHAWWPIALPVRGMLHVIRWIANG